LMFAVLLAAVILFNRKPPSSLEDAAAVARYATKEKLVAAQAGALPAAQIAAAIPLVATALATSKPAAVERPEQVVPGSATALKLAAEYGAPAATGVSAPPAAGGNNTQPATPPVAPAKP